MIYIACPANYNNAAVRALHQEGLEIVECPLDDDFAYGKLLTSIWRKGQGFVLVEGDIIPWPGACKQLWDCPEAWCGFEYPCGQGNLSAALGCTRVSDRIVKANPDLPYRVEAHKWDTLHWNAVDHIVLMAIHDVANQNLHLHTPPVAHARERIG
jgi:hypothetical protein